MLTRLATTTHEELYRVADHATGLRGFIALHSTRLGPAAGGLRMRSYDSDESALQDVLNLSRGMSYKNAAAGLPLGGGKAVIMGDPVQDKSVEKLRAMGRAVAMLEGRYWTAEDMGMTPDDMAELAKETRFVAGLARGEHASGDPSPVTARGVFNAMQIGARHRFGSDNLGGRRVAVQGLGHVGYQLCQLLHEAGAKLVVADPDFGRMRRAVNTFDAEAVTPDGIHAARADIFAPCAIGGTLNPETVSQLQARLVAGAANNQLARDGDAQRLHARNILYLPDYVANAGGIINVAVEILSITDRAAWTDEKLAALQATMERILTRAAADGVSPALVADRVFADKLLREEAC